MKLFTQKMRLNEHKAFFNHRQCSRRKTLTFWFLLLSAKFTFAFKQKIFALSDEVKLEIDDYWIVSMILWIEFKVNFRLSLISFLHIHLYETSWIESQHFFSFCSWNIYFATFVHLMSCLRNLCIVATLHVICIFLVIKQNL